MITALLWAIWQLAVIIPCRQLGTDNLSRNVGKELQLRAT